MLSSRLAARSLSKTRGAPRWNSSTGVVEHADAAPTRQQLWAVFVQAAVPMVGFGFMDQTVMLQAGHAIDCTIGVTFGLSTLTAAAFGQVCSDASGVLFGGTLESLANRAGLPQAGLSVVQRSLPIIKQTKLAGSFVGVILGCTLGLFNLFLIDTDRSSTLKLQAFTGEQEFEFQIEASNAARVDATALTVRGPDLDGILASMTAALVVRGCSLVELHAMYKTTGETEGNNEDREIVDTFYVVDRETGEPFHDEDLEDLAKSILDATRTPMNITVVRSKMKELEKLNANLKDRVQRLELVVIEKQIKVIPRAGAA
jgi:hypothetical protein